MNTNTLNGILQSGGTSQVTPIPGIVVTLYEATNESPVALGWAITNADGSFSISATESTSSGVLFASASVLDDVQLVAIVGTSLPSSVTINELTTVAAAFCMAQFTQNGVIAGNVAGLKIAAAMNDNLVSPATGASSEVLLSSPNGDQTNSLRSTRSLANLLAAIVQQTTGMRHLFFKLTTPPEGEAPTGTFQALVNIARNPGNNVTAIYQQTSMAALYAPPLVVQPDAWTIAVKVNDSGDVNSPFGGPGNIAFDANGYGWITNNVVQGKPGSTNNLIVLQPNGKPSDGSNGTPKSPITGGGLLGGGFGMAIDGDGYVWAGNFGWGGDNPTLTPHNGGTGSVTKLSPSGEPLSVPNGYFGGTERAQGIAVDQDNNIWIASFGNDRVVVFPKGDPESAFGYPELSKGGIGGSRSPAPFGVAIASDGSAWVTSGGGLFASPYTSPGHVSRYVIENGALVQTFTMPLGHALKGIAIDSLGYIWVASGGDSVVYVLSPEGELLGTFNGGGIDSPWSVYVDGSDNVWVANFGAMGPTSNYTTAAVSHLAGANSATRPPGLNMGDPISPSAGYTLPSAGAPVLLNNGDPLYGPGTAPSYTPLTRMTNVVADRAGNLWAMNNWKPRFSADAGPEGNPGGDGIVIFVGVASPG